MNPKPFYQENTPTVNLSFADWQPAFLANFQVLAQAFAQNHVALDASSNLGNHTVVELIQQPNGPQTNLSELSLYAKNVQGQTDQTFMRFQGNGTEFQYTNYQIYQIAENSEQTTYFTSLPGSLIIYFGVYLKTTTSGKIIKLMPPICKNITSVNLTALGSPSYDPSVSLIKNDDGIITGVGMTTHTGTPVPQCYTIVGNT